MLSSSAIAYCSACFLNREQSTLASDSLANSGCIRTVAAIARLDLDVHRSELLRDPAGAWFVCSICHGAIDDILLHVRKIRPRVRMLIVGAAGFAAGELLHDLRGPDSGVVQFILHSVSGFVPAMISSWLAHKYAEQPQAAPCISLCVAGSRLLRW